MSIQDRPVEERLGQRGIRYTEGRRSVIHALEMADGPRSAAEIFGDLDRAVPLSSIYRSLAVLEEAGVVSPHQSTRAVTRFEMAEWLAGHHHHLVCVECGAVEDIKLPTDLEEQLEGVVARVTELSEFEALGHSLEVDGRCARCA